MTKIIFSKNDKVDLYIGSGRNTATGPLSPPTQFHCKGDIYVLISDFDCEEQSCIIRVSVLARFRDSILVVFCFCFKISNKR